MQIDIDAITEAIAANLRYNVGKLRSSGAWMGIEVPKPKKEPAVDIWDQKAGND